MDQATKYAEWLVKNQDKKGTPEFDTVAQAYKQVRSAGEMPDAAVETGNVVNQIPRQLGLSVRPVIEAAGSAVGFLSEPIRAVTDRVFGYTGKTRSASDLATALADKMGLPKPETPMERSVAEGTKMGYGAMMGTGLLKNFTNPLVDDAATAVTKSPLAQGLADRVRATKSVIPMLADKPAQQVASAAGAGFMGQSSKEAGGGPLEQTIASVIGGVVGGLTPGALNKVTTTLTNLRTTPLQLEGKIALALKEGGVDFDQLSAGVRNQLVQDVRKALNTGGELNPEALRRLADLRAAGLTPTRGAITLDPIQVTREMNLAKLGANTGDESLYTLPRIQNQNNAQLITNLNNMGASRGDPVAAGETVVNTILGRQNALRGAEQSLWDAAKNSPGYRAPVQAGVLSDINRALDEQGLMPFMNPTISRYMAAFQTGNQPFTPQAYRNLQSMLSNEIAKGGNEGAAARAAANILRNADLKPAGFVNGGNLPVTSSVAAQMRNADQAAGDAVDAVNRARNATRNAYAFEDSSPLVRSVLADPDPQKIAQRFIVGGTAREAEELIQAIGPRNLEPIKNALIAQLKEKALSGAADETGKFSQAAFNKALRQIGERKLSLFFSPEEIQALQQNARAASYIQFQPAGSAVNNSNSGALMLGNGYDFLRGVAGKIPFGQQLIVDPLRNIDISLSQRGAQNITKGLLNPTNESTLAPYVLPMGLLSSGVINSP